MTTQPYRLKAESAYWERPPVADINALSKEELVDLVKELDRRFFQLWDKVVFEREHGLVNYEHLNTNKE